MCGITGYSLASSDVSPSLVRVMIDALSNRGPDGPTFEINEFIHMGIARLSIHDLENGWQPFYSKDKRFISTVNGEIYNFRELNRYLRLFGYKNLTNNDCEPIANLFEVKKPSEVFSLLNGMFSCAVVDKVSKILYLSRDINGEKPLYYTILNGEIYYSSDINSFFRAKIMPGIISEDSLKDFLAYSYNPGVDSIFNNIKSIAPGTFLEFNLSTKKYKIERYSSVGAHESVDQDLEDVIIKSVIRQMSSDVPIGIALSSGLDSTLLASIAVCHSTSKLHTFSLGYEGNFDNDELAIASKFASELNTKHHKIRINSDNFVDDFDDYAFSLNEPVGDISGYSYYRIFKEAKQNGIKVILMGHGVDEFSFSYNWAYVSYLVNLKKIKSINMFSFFALLSKRILFNYSIVQFSIKDWLRSIRDLYQYLISSFYHHPGNDFICDEISPPFMQYKKIIGSMGKFPNLLHHINRKLDIDPSAKFCIESLSSGYLLKNGFSQIDSLSMANSVEARNPFVDKYVQTKFLDRYKSKLSAKSGKKEYMYIYEKYLPDYIMHKKKTGFGVPVPEYVNKLKERHSVLDCLNHIKSYCNSTLVDQLIIKNDNLSQMQIFKIILLSRWLAKFEV
jgi:asparagine synthase (glutamine-hydrolysing)